MPVKYQIYQCKSSLTAYLSNAIQTLYEKFVFAFSPSYVGYLDALQSSLLILSMALPSVLYYTASFQTADVHWVQLGCLGKAAFYLLYPFAASTWEVFALSALFLLCGSVIPRARSICTSAVAAEEQAAVQASFSALQAVSLLLSIFASLGYSYTASTYPGAMYYACLGLVAAAAALVAAVVYSPDLFVQLSRPSAAALGLDDLANVLAMGGAGPGGSGSGSSGWDQDGLLREGGEEDLKQPLLVSTQVKWL